MWVKSGESFVREGLKGTNHFSHIMCHIWHVLFHTSNFTCHISYVMFHMSHFKNQILWLNLLCTISYVIFPMSHFLWHISHVTFQICNVIFHMSHSTWNNFLYYLMFHISCNNSNMAGGSNVKEMWRTGGIVTMGCKKTCCAGCRRRPFLMQVNW